jgi:hypothetical protein
MWPKSLFKRILFVWKSSHLQKHRSSNKGNAYEHPQAKAISPQGGEAQTPQVKGQTPQVKGQTPQVKGRNNRGKKHIPADLQERILQFCNVPRAIMEIVDYLGLKDRKGVRVRGISPLVEQGRLAMTIPQSPNSRFQKYITIK